MTTTQGTASPGRSESVTWGGLLHLFVVYLVWGSTYLAIRVAVRDGSGLSPFFLGASRTLPAALLLLGWNALRGSHLRPTPTEWRTLIVSGLLLWVGGNGLVNWAEQHTDSGYAALLVGTTPMWVALMESGIDRRRPSLKLLAALVVGFGGLAVLTYPVLKKGEGGADLHSVVALLFAPLSWGMGSLLQARRPVRLPPSASSAYQQLFGGIGFALVAILVREPWPEPSPGAWVAWGYLLVAGSLIAFTSFIQALRLLPTRIVMTYAYVNPVIAVFMGWLVLDEPITTWTLAGTALVLLGVAGVFQAKKKKASPVASYSSQSAPNRSFRT